ncbi:MAG: hypothetical protein IJS93_00935 [Clostridia bacterium]|nr:hypothetical protein [Clostridia bacterium]
MSNSLIGLSLREAERILTEKGISYTVVNSTGSRDELVVKVGKDYALYVYPFLLDPARKENE